MPALSVTSLSGVPSDTVAALRQLAIDPASDSAFKEILDTGSPAAQLYALCGVYFTDPEAFAAHVRRLSESSQPEVVAMFGCVMSPVPLASVLQRIADGDLPRSFLGEVLLRQP